ncbi:peptidoglycan-binding protein [Patescibacteria group bacterium]|nr:peptidoglycan-binding protein [Patescibacteria group bacterium]
MIKKWPSKKQWRHLLTVLNKKEKIIFSVLLGLFLTSFIVLCFDNYYYNTTIIPTKGGTHIEGVIGQPRFINPIYANSDADRDLSTLIFSGLMKFDENLNIVPDLAERYEIDENGKIYTFYLKENLKWQDSEPITIDDIIFTIQTIQNPNFKSPLQANWVGVNIEKIDNSTIRFILRKPYIAFLENSTVGILPQHIWKDVPAEKFAFESYNLDPIGSGPFKIKNVKERSNQISSITLKQNSLYYGKKPNISEIKFLFFKNEEDLIKAAKKNNVNGISLTSPVEINKDWENHLLSLPRYFAVFFNLEGSDILKDANIRLALNYATDKKAINQKIVDSPILPEIYGFDLPEKTYEFDLEKAKELLSESGYENNNGILEKTTSKELAFSFKSRLAKGSKNKEVTELQKCLGGEVSGYFGPQTEQLVKNFQKEHGIDPLGFVGTGTRKALNDYCFEKTDEITKLSITLITVDQPKMVAVAEILKEQWKEVGVELIIESRPLFQLEQDFIKPRNYEALLFGEVLGAIPDPFPFWHSSQKNDPGLNLSVYEDAKADKYLEENRKASDLETRLEQLDLFQNKLIEGVPAVFLYSPDFVYATSQNLKGVEVNKITDPSKRFIGIEDWYIKTKRIWK